jgi:hypothetical protein
LHNPDCCYQQAFDFSVFLLVCCLTCYYLLTLAEGAVLLNGVKALVAKVGGTEALKIIAKETDFCFSNLIVMHIREGGSILSLALINLCIILIVVINKLLISLYFCWCVAVELGYTQAVDIKLIADSQDNRKGHHGEDNNIYLNDANLNNTKDLATTLGHE